MERTAQIRKEKQQYIITLRHEGQSKILQEQSQKPSRNMVKLALMRTATGKEDTELPLLQRISSLELHKIQWTDTSTVQRRLRESDIHGRISAKKPLLKDTNNKKRLASAEQHEQWTLDWWKSVLWSDESKCFVFGSNCRVFVRCRVGEEMISACVVPTLKLGGGVMVWGCDADDTGCDLFRIQGTLNQHGYHSILQRYAIPSSLRLVGL